MNLAAGGHVRAGHQKESDSETGRSSSNLNLVQEEEKKGQFILTPTILLKYSDGEGNGFVGGGSHPFTRAFPRH